MITKLKAIIFASFATIPLACNAAYTTMTIDGVKQANGLWTATGVMDSMGFVRTTGAVSVAGITKTTAVALPVDMIAASAMLRGASRLAGPLMLASTAYDVYNWITTDPNVDIKAKDNDWNTSDDLARFGTCHLNNGYQVAATWETCRGIFADNYRQYSADPSKYVLCGNGENDFFAVNTPSCTKQNVGWFQGAKKTRKSTDADFNKLANPSPSTLANGFNNIPSLITSGVPIKGTSFTPFSEWLSDPYFKDGNWYRDRVDISPCPTASEPTRVCVDIGPQKFEGATDPQTVPSQATGTATGNTTKENTDFCKKNPQSIACAELGKLDDEELEVDERPIDVSYTPWGSSNSQCPADKIIPLWEGHTLSLSWLPICQFASLLRPLVIALAFVAAGFIVAGITRKGGGDA